MKMEGGRICEEGYLRRYAELELGFGALLLAGCRCNATVEERRCWLDLALISKRGCRGVVAVHFDVTPEECIVRVAARVGHLTLPPHRGARAVASFAYTFQVCV